MARFSVESVFKAVDRVSAPIRKMQSRISKFTRSAQRGFRNLNRAVNKFGSGLKRVARVGAVGLVALGFAMANVIRTGAEFEQTLVNAAVKFPEGIRRGTEAFKELEEVARGVGATTEFTAKQAAEGLNFLAFAGFNAEQAMAALPGVVDLATAAQLDLGTASDIVTDSLGAFGLATKDSVQQAKNLARVSDVLALTSIRTNTSVETLFEGIVKGAPAFTAAGQSVESFSALMGVMANSGIKGAEAGTVLRNMMINLGAPTSTAAKTMKGLGIEIADSDGNFRDILDIMADFEKGLEGLGEVQRTAALFAVFGKRSISGLSVQLKEGTTTIAKFRNELRDAGGTTKSMADIMRDTLMGQLRSLLSAVESVKLSLFDLKNEALEGTVVKLVEFTRSVNAAINANKEMAALLVDKVLQAGLGLIGVFAQLVALFILLKTVTLAWSAVTITATVVAGAYNLAMGLTRGLMLADVTGKNLSKGATIAWVVGTKLATAAQWLFNAALTANPIGLVIVAVGALIALGVLLIKNWDGIVAAISSAVNKIKGLLGIVFAPLSAVIEGFSGIFSIAKVLGFGGGEEESSATDDTGATRRITQQSQVAHLLEERRETSTSELTIKDETGRAEMTKKGKASGIEIDLFDSGAFAGG